MFVGKGECNYIRWRLYGDQGDYMDVRGTGCRSGGTCIDITEGLYGGLCGGVWWCLVVYGGVWWCVVVCGGVWWCVVGKKIWRDGQVTAPISDYG